MPAEAAKEWPSRDDGMPALQIFQVPDVDPEDHPLGSDNERPVPAVAAGHDRDTQFPGSDIRSSRSPPGMTLAGCKGSDRSDCLRGAARPELRDVRLRPPSSATVPCRRAVAGLTGIRDGVSQ